MIFLGGRGRGCVVWLARSVPWPGTSPGPQQQKSPILASRPSGSSLFLMIILEINQSLRNLINIFLHGYPFCVILRKSFSSSRLSELPLFSSNAFKLYLTYLEYIPYKIRGGDFQFSLLQWVVHLFPHHLLSAHVLSRFSRVGLFGTLMDCSPPGLLFHGIFQVRIQESRVGGHALLHIHWIT